MQKVDIKTPKLLFFKDSVKVDRSLRRGWWKKDSLYNKTLNRPGEPRAPFLNSIANPCTKHAFHYEQTPRESTGQTAGTSTHPDWFPLSAMSTSAKAPLALWVPQHFFNFIMFGIQRCVAWASTFITRKIFPKRGTKAREHLAQIIQIIQIIVPRLPSWEAVQDVRSITCAISCSLHGSHPATSARSYKIGSRSAPWTILQEEKVLTGCLISVGSEWKREASHWGAGGETTALLEDSTVNIINNNVGIEHARCIFWRQTQY